MAKTDIIRCIVTVLCFAVMTGCSEKNGSGSKAEPLTTAAITTDITEAATSTSTADTTTTTTEAAVTTTEIATVKEAAKKKLDRIAESLEEPSEFRSPFGDISNAYVCFGGTALYPSVRVLSADEVKKLSKVLNAMTWEELPDKPKVPYTPGPSDLTLYVNDNGKRSELDLLGDIYRDENGNRYFRTESPATAKESFTVYQICDDLLFTSDLKDVSTHLSELRDITQSDGNYDINDYWDLIWDDVMRFINGEEKQADS